MNPSLGIIRSFLTLARHLHFGRAAEALSITQPALSNQIKLLERSLGVRLFARTTRWVSLTPEGERFLRRAQRIVSDIESAFVEMANPTAPPRGTVAFACIPTIAGHIFPRIINEFHARHPEIKVAMIDETTVELERRIANREVDFGIGGSPRRKHELAFTPIFSDPFVLVCHRSHPLAKRKRVAINDVLGSPVISLGKDSNVHRTIENYFALAGYVFEPQFELNHHYTIGAMIEAGLGLAFLPSQAAERMRASKFISIIATNEPSFARHVGLITRRGESLAPAADSFYAFALTAIRRNRAKHRPQTEQKRLKKKRG
jgi:DNA-binding transcriptional LysR family regulator